MLMLNNYDQFIRHYIQYQNEQRVQNNEVNNKISYIKLGGLLWNSYRYEMPEIPRV